MAAIGQPSVQPMPADPYTQGMSKPSQSHVICEGDRVPDVFVWQVQPSQGDLAANQGEMTRTVELFYGGTAVIVGVPGAFTPVCTSKHVSGYVQGVGEFHKHDIQVYIVAPNDPFVMAAWAQSLGAKAHTGLFFLSDGNGELNARMGLGLDMTGRGMGYARSKRYCMIVQDGLVKRVMVEKDPSDLKVTDADHVLQEALEVVASGHAARKPILKPT